MGKPTRTPKKSPTPVKASKKTTAPKQSKAAEKKEAEKEKKKEAEKEKKRAKRLSEIKKDVERANKNDGGKYSYKERWEKMEEIFFNYAYKLQRITPNFSGALNVEEKLEFISEGLHRRLDDWFEERTDSGLLDCDDCNLSDAELGLEMAEEGDFSKNVDWVPEYGRKALERDWYKQAPQSLGGDY